MLGEVAMCAWVAYQIYKRINLVPALAFLYFSGYAAYSQYSKVLFYSPLANVQADFAIATARSFSFLLCAAIPFIFSKPEQLKEWLKAFQLLALVNSLIMLGRALIGQPAYGMLGMDSVDGVFNCILLPSFIFYDGVFKRQNLIAAAPLILSIAIAKSSTAYGTFVFESLICLFVMMEKKVTNFVILAAGAFCSIPIGKIYLGDQVFNSNGRHQILLKSLEVFNMWAVPFKYVWGLGTGAFIVLMPLVQDRSQPFFTFMHNEPAQVMLETGTVGAILLLVLYTYMCAYSFKNLPVFLMVCGAGFQSFFQPCFRYFIFASLLVLLVRLSFETKTVRQGEVLCSPVLS